MTDCFALGGQLRKNKAERGADVVNSKFALYGLTFKFEKLYLWFMFVMANFDEDNNNCIYYVVHAGDTDVIKGQKKDERIVTSGELEIILKSIVNFCVPFEKIETDRTNNFIAYSNIDASTEEKYSAYQVNLNAYGLAVLCNKYINSEIGKNILFGQNLREALATGSKTFSGMCKTLDNELDY